MVGIHICQVGTLLAPRVRESLALSPSLAFAGEALFTAPLSLGISGIRPGLRLCLPTDRLTANCIVIVHRGLGCTYVDHTSSYRA